jgi:serine protease
MNKLAIESQAEHNSETHEIFGVSGVRTNRFDPTGNVEPDPDGTRFESDRELVIPDNDPNGVTDTITVPLGQGPVGSLTIDVSIEHTYVGDLTVTLTHGDKYFTLHSREGGADDNLSLHLVTEHFAGADAAGEWTLQIVDNANLDSGKLTGWAIEL